MKTKDEVLDKVENLLGLDFFRKVILSGPLLKGESLPKKIVISRFLSKNKDFFQFEYFIGEKVIHKNVECENMEFIEVLNIMEDSFKQCQVKGETYEFTILMNKNKLFKLTGIKKIAQENSKKMEDNAHNKVKNYILKEGYFYDWLYHLKVINKDGHILKNKQKKFKQINKFLEMLQSVEQYLPENANIVDMGCGKSYLTFAIYYYFNKIKSKNVNIKGFDLKKDVVENCNELAKKLKFEKLQFFNEDISNLENSAENIHMLISLHACDTATDYAIFYAVKYGCKVVLSVPCCQHEVFSQISSYEMNSILSYGILKERFSAILTDTLRADALKLCGYKTSVLEFIDMEHTPKNIMIKAIKNEDFKKNSKKVLEYEKLIQSFNIKPKIYQLLKNYF